MRLIARLILLSLIVSLPMVGAARESHQLKADTIRYLQDLRTQNVKRLLEIDQTLERKIEDGRPADLEKDIASLRTAKREHMLRQEFLDRLIFQVDTKFVGGDLRQFLERALTEMAKVDAVTSAVDTGLWKFLKFAADAVRRLPEQKENIVSFLEGYMNRSISNPVRPDDYLNSRNYTNGAMSESGSPISREDAGSVADRRIRELGADAETHDDEDAVLPAPQLISPQ